MMFYIYILYSDHADKFYIGHTSNPANRELQHQNNPTEKFTGKYDNWKILALFEVSQNRAQAMKIENWIKKQKSRKLIEKLIDPNFKPDGQLAQLVRVPLVRD